jgi:hypothetical protein
VTAFQPIMTRKFRVRIRNPDGKLLFTFKGNVIKKEQSEGRMGGDVDETLYVNKYSIVKPRYTKRNEATVDRASITSQEFGQILFDIGKEYLKSPDSKPYSLESFFSDLAMLIHDMFEKDAEGGIETARLIANEADFLSDVLIREDILEQCWNLIKNKK